MSVLKNKRGLSKYEYEHSFKVLYEFTNQRLVKVANRRKQWLCQPINALMNEAYITIMELSTGYVPPKEREKYHYELLKRSIECLEKLQNPLYTIWNVMGSESNQTKHWCELINSEKKLLFGMFKTNAFYNIEKDGVMKHTMYFSKEEVNKAKFLKKMSDLHIYTHGKVIRANRDYDLAESSLLIQFVDDAWYYCIEANKILPKTREEYTRRKEYISKAISCLRKMNRPLLSLFNLMEYSNRIMREWSDLVTDELALLYNLQKSDKLRFSMLA